MRRLSLLLSLLAASCTGGGSSGTCVANLLPGDLVISEVMSDPTGADTGKEWFEVYNGTSKPIDMTGLTLVSSSNAGTGENVHVMKRLQIPAKSYVALGGVVDALKPSYLAYGFANDLGALRNTNGRLALRCNGMIIDETTYTKVSMGAAWQFTGAIAPDAIGNDDQTKWCDATKEYETGNKGSPGMANDTCAGGGTPGTCDDNGTMRDTVAPAVGDVVISEFLADPAKVGDAAGEWFELAVLHDVDLNGLEIGNTPGTVKSTVTDVSCRHFAAGSFAVFARGSDAAANGMLPQVDFVIPSGVTMTNSAGSLFVGIGGDTLDAVTWTSTASGVAAQLDPGKFDPAANDDPTAFCAATTVYGAGDKGTPGAANVACMGVTPTGKCNDNGTMRDVVVAKAGDLVIDEFMADPSKVSDAAGEWFEVAVIHDADLNGLQIGNTPGTVKTTVTDANCRHFAAGAFAVLARGSDAATNGMLPQVDFVIPSSVAMNNGAGGLFIGAGGMTLDAITWTAAASGAAAQLDPSKLDPAANDDPAAFCAAKMAYGAGDLGTPGMANPTCM